MQTLKTNARMKSTDSKHPVAEKIPKELEKHGDVRIDNYFWMRLSDTQKLAPIKDKQTQKVVDYLEAENTYYKDLTAYTKNFQEELFLQHQNHLHQRT